MRTYEELTPAQQAQATEQALKNLLGALVQGVPVFEGTPVQAKIERAGRKANAMQTPWFWAEYIMDYAGAELRESAADDARFAVYLDPGEQMPVRIDSPADAEAWLAAQGAPGQGAWTR